MEVVLTTEDDVEKEAEAAESDCNPFEDVLAVLPEPLVGQRKLGQSVVAPEGRFEPNENQDFVEVKIQFELKLEI